MKHTTVRAAREAARLTVQRLAERSGVAKATISRLETGAITNPRYATVRALEKALKLAPGTLVFPRQGRAR